MITPEQKEARKRYIGASDSAALFGLDPWRTASDTYLDKTGQLEEWQGNEATERGEKYEAVTIEYAAERIGREVLDALMVVTDDGLLCANLDGFLGNGDGQIEAVVEAKYSSVRDEWGEEGTDQIPPQYTIQVHHQMYVCGPQCRTAWVALTLIEFNRLKFRLYRVQRDDELAETIAERARKFMTEHVIPRIPPADFLPSAEVLKRVKRVPNKRVSMPFELLDDLIVAKAALKKAEEECELAERHVKAVMGDAEAAYDSMGRELTYYAQTRRGIDTKALKAERPELAAAYEKESTFRVLKLIKKG